MIAGIPRACGSVNKVPVKRQHFLARVQLRIEDDECRCQSPQHLGAVARPAGRGDAAMACDTEFLLVMMIGMISLLVRIAVAVAVAVAGPEPVPWCWRRLLCRRRWG